MQKLIGQRMIRNRLEKWAEQNYFPNVLFRGNPGTGKTLLALSWGEILKEKLNKRLFHTMLRSGVVVNPTDDLYLLDEIHNLANEEAWYNKDVGIIGCTTEGAPISEAFQSRFHVFWMEPYNTNELAKIVRMYSPKLIPEVCFTVALRCRNSPREARKIGEELTALFEDGPQTRQKAVHILQQVMGIHEGGFTRNDFAYMKFLSRGKASLRTIAASTGIPELAIRDEVEPFLLQNNLIRITSRGRELV